MLKIDHLSVHYGAAEALADISLEIGRGETVALVGANGAGKSTFLKTIMGILSPTRGDIYFQGEKITGLSPTQIVRRGVSLSPEGRELFGELTVGENLILGVANQRLSKGEKKQRIEAILDYFPPLQNRLQQQAGTLSGGEQQMVAMGRALMSAPGLLLLDEPSLGLSPLITDQLFDIIRQVARTGTTILLVEQNAARALSGSQKAYLIANGRIVNSGISEELLIDPQLRRAFLGAGSHENPGSSRLGASGLTNIRLEKAPMNHNLFTPGFENEEALARHQLKGLQWTLKHAYEGSSFYRERFDRAGIRPEDIQALKAIEKLPFTTAEDLRDGYPFPLRAVPFEQVVRVHASSGTTGQRKVLCYTQKDLDDWANFFARAYAMAGVTPLDRVQIAVGYGVWTAGMGFQLGCEKIGAMAVPIGPGNVDMQCQFLVDFQSTVFCSTASMALLMAEEIHHRGLTRKINVKKIIYGSERSSRSMRQKISELFGGAELFDITGLTELYGPGSGMECSQHDCIHYWGDYYILEIIDPETLQPLPPGEWGEMVVTSLCKEAAPLIRYRTHDITRIIPERCPCGTILPRHSRIKGRTDDMFIFRGVNIYPSSIESILAQVPGLGSEYQVHLSRDEKSGRDAMQVIVEKGKGVENGRIAEITAETAYQIRKKLLVSTEVKIVDYATLPRSERKSKRIFDQRIKDSII